MRKQTLLRSTSMTRRFYRPSLRLGKHGHPMRDPDGHDAGAQGGQGGNDSQGGGDNNGGNGGNNGQSGGNGASPQNNGGGGFDPSSFWNSPPADNPAAPNSGGSASGNQSGGTQQNQNEGNAFAQALSGLNFGSGVYTQEAAEAMGNGNADPFNQNMTNFGREVTRQAVIMSAQLMQRHGQQMEERFQRMVEERFGQRDTEFDLGKEIPSYNQPGMKPIVDGIMAQALKLTKGDRKAAIEMSKQMLKFSTKNLGQDFGITTPPNGAGNDFGTGQTTNWEEELLGR